MKVNFNVSIKDFRGQDVILNDKPVMLADKVAQLLFNYGNMSQVPADDKWRAYKLCNRLMESGELELTTEEGAFVLNICGQALTAGVYGRVRDLIEENH